jgi:hypothetical protein
MNLRKNKKKRQTAQVMWQNPCPCPKSMPKMMSNIIKNGNPS